MKKVAFIGLGLMGLSMARNIMKAGHTVVGFDRKASQMQLHVANGGEIADSAALATAGADFVITMLPVGSIVTSAIFGEQGIAETLADDAIFIDMSTIHPLESDDIREELKRRGKTMIDAPVGRTSVEAAIGKCLIMAGGNAESLLQAQPIFECMGDTIIDCGGIGTGIRMKIVNNFMTTALNALSAECLTLSDKVGLNRDLAIEVMSGTAAIKSHMLTTYPAKVLKNDLSPAFAIDLANKDLLISLDLGKRYGINMAMGQAASTVYKEAQDMGLGNQDWTSLYAMLSPEGQKA
ncbi:MAG: 4-hydroxybutyrate dehydrogenase/sulfolactaldehyde 3-reductase [Cellvibrionaceae bacterium]|jgi:4-hydroxybutyrate dehydrogenase/sulfolactaldehyde 3-reductase